MFWALCISLLGITLGAYFGVQRTWGPEATAKNDSIKAQLRSKIDTFCTTRQEELMNEIFETASTLDQSIEEVRRCRLSFLFAAALFGLAGGSMCYVEAFFQEFGEDAPLTPTMKLLVDCIPVFGWLAIISVVVAFWFIFWIEHH